MVAAHGRRANAAHIFRPRQGPDALPLPGVTKSTATTTHSASTPAATPPPNTTTQPDPVGNKPPATTTTTTRSVSTPGSTASHSTVSSFTTSLSTAAYTPGGALPIAGVTTGTMPDLSGGGGTILPGGIGGGDGSPPSFSMPDPATISAANVNAATSGPQLKTTTIIGMAAGGIIGLAFIIAAISFMMKRCGKRRDDQLGEVFDRNEFSRHSMRIPDDAPITAGVGSARGGSPDMHENRRGPRPPTMIGRHQQAYGYGATPQHQPQAHQYPPEQYGQYQQHQGYDQYDYGHHGQQHQQYNGAGQAYEPYHDHTPQHAHYDSPVASPMGDVFPAPHDAAAHPAYLNNQVNGAGVGSSAGRNLTRRGSDERGAPQLPNLDHLARGQSVTPYQAAQYAEISRNLRDQPHGQQGQGPEAAYARLAREAGVGHPQQQQQQHHQQQQYRPGSEYEEQDAYGGI